MPIHTLIVGMSPETGGIENFVLQIVKHMDVRRFRFDILTFCAHCAYEEDYVALGCKVFHAARRGKNPIRHYRDQKRFFSNHRDAYHFVWLHLSSASDLSTILIAKKYTRAKIICHSHGTFFDSRGGIIRKMHLFLHMRNRQKLIKHTDLFFACSQKAGEWLYGDIGDKLKIIPNGIDTGKFRFNKEKRDIVRKNLNVEGKIVLGHAGRLAEVKNQAFLIDIFAAFHIKYENSILLIAGTGALQDKLHEKVNAMALSDCVKFLGFRSDIPDLLQAFDIFILPSLYEGLPITLIEAQTCGLPCVVSDTITREVAATDLIHFVSLGQDIRDWVSGIEKALTQSRGLADYEARMIQSGYSSQASIEKLSNIMEENDNKLI